MTMISNSVHIWVSLRLRIIALVLQSVTAVGAYTAWAGELIPGQTIAVNLKLFLKLSWVYDGYGYRHAEDTAAV